jgi:LPS-assembly protein
MTRLRHLLVPELSYGYVQNRDQDSLPFFDWNDRVVGQQVVGWALTSTLTGKLAGGGERPVYRDLLYLRLSQGYNLAGSRRNLLVMEDPGHRLTDLRIEARITPLERLSIATDSYLNLHDLGFSQSDLTAQYTFQLKTYLGLSYQYAQGQLHYLEGRVGIGMFQPFTFTYTTRYSFDRHDFLESVYGLEYRHQCWSVLFSYHDRPGDQGFTVNFSLLGIGSLGPMRIF